MAREKTLVRSTIQVDGTWDIETENWSTFVCGCIYTPERQDKVRTFSHREEEAFVDALLSTQGTLWAHNGGRFDTLWLLGHLWKRSIVGKIGLSGSSVACLELDGAIFRDSARLLPMTLEKAAQLGGVPKAATSLPCSCARACGGYCSISRRMPRALYERLRSYMVRDCEALYAALDALSTLCERHDIDLKPTIGASAWATVARQGAEKADWGDGVNVTRAYRNTRRGYYGGRTQVLRPMSAVGTHWDINSAYPAALANLHLPTGDREELDDGAASKAYAGGKLGVYCADVDVPKHLFFPPLPVRTTDRIAYPVGYVGGWWTSLELAQAESRGAVVRRVSEGVVWSSSAMVLSPFCQRIWALRDAAGPKTPLGGFFKLLANSLTGKCATKAEQERITVDANRPIFCPGGDCRDGRYCGIFGCCFHRCTGACGVSKPIAAGFPIFSEKVSRLSNCSHIEWAAYLTAYTRRELQLFAGEEEDLVYCDTDSLFCETSRTERIGSALGEWKLEDRYADFYALAPKTYSYFDADTGEAHAAAKGIPEAVRNFCKLKDGVVNDRGVNTFKRALQVGTIFERRNLTRQIRTDGVHFGDRTLGADGRTYPPASEGLRLRESED